MSRLYLIGIGSRGLSAEKKKIVRSCGLVVGSARHLSCVTDLPAEKIAITPLDRALVKIRSRLPRHEVAVLASGDPLFFGIGRRLLAEFEQEEIVILPALSFLQEACSRFRMSWDDAALVSLHGRRAVHAPGLLLHNTKTLAFTDRRNTPDALARKIADYLGAIGAVDLLGEVRISVAQDLGGPEEKVICGGLHEIGGQNFNELNILAVSRPPLPQRTAFSLGLTEDDFNHSRGLITKDEVRAVTLHRLRLPANGIMWDIGAGSGSVAIEAARLQPDLTLYAVERREEELANITANIRRFGCFNLVPVAGSAPAAMAALPDPDAVFLGGSGGALVEIIDQAARRLKRGGRLVVNAVTAKTAETTPRHLLAAGLGVTTTRIEVRRNHTGHPQGSGRTFNPIMIITGEK